MTSRRNVSSQKSTSGRIVPVPVSPKLQDDLESLSSATSQETWSRHPTVYDAVAERVGTTWKLNEMRQGLVYTTNPQSRRKYHTRTAVLPPEEVLFQTEDAPDRYAEGDIYMAHDRDLPAGGQGVLPDSDLLKAVHAYTSRFYSHNHLGSPPEPAPPRGRGRVHYYRGMGNANMETMDETALLAFGILLEEAGRETLGRTGDLVFTEGEEITSLTAGADDHRQEYISFGDVETTPPRKRRKIRDDGATPDEP